MISLTRTSLKGLVVAMLIVSGTILGLSSHVATVPAASAATLTHIRVLHAVPDAPAVDIYVNGKLAVSKLAFPKQTPFLNVPAGKYHLQVFPTGAMYSAMGGVINAMVPFHYGMYYTVAAIGTLKTIHAAVEVDNLAMMPAMGKAAIRFVHFSPNAPAVDIIAKGAGVIFANTAFYTADKYIQVRATTYNLSVTPAGKSAPVVLSLPGVKLQDGHIYTVYAVGLLGGKGVQALGVALTDDKAGMM